MRQRITHLFEPVDFIDTNSLTISKNSISSANPIISSNEERITFQLDELPHEIHKLLETSKELHIRWVTERNFPSVDPLASRLSPGLHIFYTPFNGINSSTICSTVKKTFGDIYCLYLEKSFTALPRNQLSQSDSYQYYTSLSSISNLAEYLEHEACLKLPQHLSRYCMQYVDNLKSAKTLDISFSSKSDVLVVSSFKPAQTQEFSLIFPEEIDSKFKVRHEIGLLTSHPSQNPDEISLGGFLTVLGDDRDPKPTVFSFTPRHRRSNINYSAFFLEPSGMHPNLELRISDVASPVKNQACELYVFLTLPSFIFIDKFQFSDSLFLADKNLSSLRYVTKNIDLEAPDYVLNSWGSSALVKLAPPPTELIQKKEWTAQIPTHLRYLLPAFNSSGLREVEVPYPVMFWTCTSDETPEFQSNPFDRTHLGYDDLFSPKTFFYHLNPVSTGEDNRLVNKLQVPVLDLNQSYWVESLTLSAIGLGFAWVCWCLLKVATGNGNNESRKEKAGETEKKVQ